MNRTPSGPSFVTTISSLPSLSLSPTVRLEATTWKPRESSETTGMKSDPTSRGNLVFARALPTAQAELARTSMSTSISSVCPSPSTISRAV